MTGAEILIRPASVADAPIIASFHLACWNDAYAGIVAKELLATLNRSDHVRTWRTRLEREYDDTTFVALAAGSVMGLATAGPSDQDPPAPPTELRSLYVAASHYGTGLAQRLVNAALGDRPASLWTFEGNERALAFYRRTGWRPTGERRFDPRGNVMELRMARPGGASSPTHGALHHVELWVPDLDRAIRSWGWLLPALGYRPFQDWPAGRSWRLGHTYLVIEQSPDLHSGPHQRRRAGLNHLAFHAGDRDQVDALVGQAPQHDWRLLFADRHPYAGGEGHYAAYLEDADGFEVELVAVR